MDLYRKNRTPRNNRDIPVQYCLSYSVGRRITKGTPMAYQGTPSYSGAPASQYSDWIHRVGAYLVETLPALIVFYIFVFAVRVVSLDIIVYLAFLGYVIYNRW